MGQHCRSGRGGSGRASSNVPCLVDKSRGGARHEVDGIKMTGQQLTCSYCGYGHRLMHVCEVDSIELLH
jgi:hypothetical protein